MVNILKKISNVGLIILINLKKGVSFKARITKLFRKIYPKNNVWTSLKDSLENLINIL